MHLKKIGEAKNVRTAGNKILARRKEGERAIEIKNTNSLIKIGWRGEFAGRKRQENKDDDGEMSDVSNPGTAGSTITVNQQYVKTINEVLGRKQPYRDAGSKKQESQPTQRQ